jgi:hypothetical protein
MKAVWSVMSACLLCGAAGLQAQDGAQAADSSLIARPGFVADAFSPGMLAKFSLGVLYDHATVQVPQWGSGPDGLQRRAEWRMAALLSRAGAEYAVERWRGTDAGYARCRCKGFGPRSRHALVSELTERRLDGSLAPPVARLAGMTTSVAVTSFGEHTGAESAAGRLAMLGGVDVGFNMLQEFWPEIRRTLLLQRRR